MKTIKLLTLALSICLCAACTARNDGKTDSETSAPDSAAAPGVGAAPDNSRAVPDSTLQKADTTSVKKQ
jgi:hypothetical protein